MKQKICIIFTGGTIGSVYSTGGAPLTTDQRANNGMQSYLIQKYGDRTDFLAFSPTQMSSENTRITNLRAIADCVDSCLAQHPNGIIVTHGTDTLCFSAALFSQLFCDIPVPLVFVSALYPMTDGRSNACSNLDAAVIFILQTDLPGIFAANRNLTDDDSQIILASRLSDCAPFTGNFASVNGTPYGHIANRRFILSGGAENPSPEELRKPRTKSPFQIGNLCEDILCIRTQALQNYRYLLPDNRRPTAIMIELYHSGTLCNAGDKESTVVFIKRCKSLGIPVILAPAESDANTYESSKDLQDLGIVAYDMSFCMARVKTMLALGNGSDLKNTLETDYFFEHIRKNNSTSLQ